MHRYNLTLYFRTIQDAMDAGYCDAVMVEDDVPECGYMAVITFHCDSFDIERGDEDQMEFTV